MASAQTFSYNIMSECPGRYAAALARSIWTRAAAFGPCACATHGAPPTVSATPERRTGLAVQRECMRGTFPEMDGSWTNGQALLGRIRSLRLRHQGRAIDPGAAAVDIPSRTNVVSSW